MVTDTVEGTLRYLVNGMDAGIAFGPPGSGAICELPDGKAPFTSSTGTGAALYPSCSLTNDKQVWTTILHGRHLFFNARCLGISYTTRAAGVIASTITRKLQSQIEMALLFVVR